VTAEKNTHPPSLALASTTPHRDVAGAHAGAGSGSGSGFGSGSGSSATGGAAAAALNADVVIAIDIETTGPRMGVNGLVAIGVVALNSADASLMDWRLLKVDTRHSLWDEDCVREFWNKYRHMLEFLTTASGVGTDVLLDVAEAARQLFAWIQMWREHSKTLLIVSDFPQFDAGWINHAFATANLPPLYTPAPGVWQKVLDTNAFHRGLKFAAVALGISERDMPRVDVRDLRHSHNPCEDARYIGVKYLRTRRAYSACFAAFAASAAAASSPSSRAATTIDAFADIGASLEDCA
jgi:hypothetical protein